MLLQNSSKIVKNLSSYEAEKQFGIPRRTISIKVKLVHMEKIGAPVRLSEEDESKIVNSLIICGEYCCPLTRFELRVYDYLAKNNKSWVFNNKITRGKVGSGIFKPS